MVDFSTTELAILAGWALAFGVGVGLTRLRGLLREQVAAKDEVWRLERLSTTLQHKQRQAEQHLTAVLHGVGTTYATVGRAMAAGPASKDGAVLAQLGLLLADAAKDVERPHLGLQEFGQLESLGELYGVQMQSRESCGFSKAIQVGEAILNRALQAHSTAP